MASFEMPSLPSMIIGLLLITPLLYFFLRCQLCGAWAGVPKSFGLPLVGSTLSFISGGPKAFKPFYDRLGAVFQVFLLGEWTIFIAGGTNVRKVLMAEGTLVQDEWPPGTRRLLGDNALATQRGAVHAQQRRMLSEAFTPESLEKMAPEIVRICRSHLGRWIEAGQLSACDAIKSFALEVAIVPLLGLDFGDDVVRKLVWHFHRYAEGLFAPPLDLGEWSAFGRGLKAREYILAQVEAAVRRRTAMEATVDGEKPHDILQVMMDGVDPETGGRLTLAQIKDQVLLQLFAGHDTTAATMAAMVHFLGVNAAAAATAHAEQREVVARFGPGEASLGREAFAAMPYLDAIIKETLRLVPPVGGGFRRSIAPFELDSGDGRKVRIPAGAKLSYSIGLTHLATPCGPDFCPERFGVDEGSTCAIDTVSAGYCPFAAGRRGCIGMPLAKLELKIFGALLLRTLHFSVDNPTAPWVAFPIPKPKDGLPITVTARADNVPVVPDSRSAVAYCRAASGSGAAVGPP